MSNDQRPETAIDAEDLGRENQNAFSNIGSMAADLWVVQDVLTGNNGPTADANSAAPGKS